MGRQGHLLKLGRFLNQAASGEAQRKGQAGPRRSTVPQKSDGGIAYMKGALTINCFGRFVGSLSLKMVDHRPQASAARHVLAHSIGQLQLRMNVCLMC